MSKLYVFIIIFLIIGALIIHQDAKDGKSFAKDVVKWVFGLGKNVKDVTSYTVKEHDWLPERVNETGDSDG